eukprot:1801895-Rhodomonas_salina.2
MVLVCVLSGVGHVRRCWGSAHLGRRAAVHRRPGLGHGLPQEGRTLLAMVPVRQIKGRAARIGSDCRVRAMLKMGKVRQ